VEFKGGVAYNGTILLKWSGSPGKPITYDGNSGGTFGTGRAVIDGQGTLLELNAYQYGFLGSEYSNSGVSYITIEGFEVKDTRYIYNDEPPWGSGPCGICIGGSGSNITIVNDDIHDIQPIALAVNNNSEVMGDLNAHSSVHLTNTTFTDANYSLASYSGVPGHLANYKIYLGWGADDYTITWGYIGQYFSSNNTVEIYENINLTSPGWSPYGSDPIGAATSYGYSIFNVTAGPMYDKESADISISDHANTTIANNTISEAGTGINLALDNYSLVYGNDISSVSWGISGGSGEMLGQNLTNVVFENNRIHDFYPYVKYGYWSGWHGDGIYLFAGSGTPTYMTHISFMANYFYGYIPEATSLIYCQAASWSNVTIYDNVFAAAGAIAIRISQGAPYVFRDFRIYNNDFVNVPLGNSASLVVQADVQNVTLRNNVFWDFGSWGGDFGIDSGLLPYGSDYNLLGDDYDYDGIILYNGTPYNLTEWTGSSLAFPHDQNSVLKQDPEFVNFPAFMGYISTCNTTGQLFLEPAQDGPSYSQVNPTFAVGDHVEYNYDGIVRTVTAVGPEVTNGYGTLPSYINVTPALSQIPAPGDMVLNWKGDTNFTFNFHIQASSPLISAGENLAGQVPAVDAGGSARNLTGPWDIGAYVFAPVPPVHLSSVAVEPTSAAIRSNGKANFTATAICTSTCPPGVAYSWSLNNGLGTLNATAGPMITFDAGSVAGTSKLIVNASLNGAKAMSPPVPITIVAPLSITSFAASSNPTTVNEITHLNVTVTGGLSPYAYGYAGLPTGCISSDSPSISCMPSVPGSFNVTVTVTDSINDTASRTITLLVVMICPAVGCSLPLTVSPGAVTIYTGGSVVFTATPWCTPSCSATYAWNLTGKLGSLNSSVANPVQFTAGNAPGNVTLTAIATLDGNEEVGSASITIVPGLDVVSIEPGSASVSTSEGPTAFTASISCTGGPCPSGTEYSWSLSSGLGTLNRTNGSSVAFTAGPTAGSLRLIVNATLDGKSVAISVPISINAPQGCQGTSCGAQPYGVGAVGLVLIMVVIVVLAVLAFVVIKRHRKKEGPSRDKKFESGNGKPTESTPVDSAAGEKT
jgi:hypothetical protein